MTTQLQRRVFLASAMILFAQAAKAFATPATVRKHLPSPKSWSSAGSIHGRQTSDLSMMLGIPRGGAVAESAANFLTSVTKTPTSLFNTALIVLGLTTAIFKVLQQSQQMQSSDSSKSKKPVSVQSLQRRFLIVFWLLRCADWLQGPYFYEVYSSKVFNGAKASLGLVSRLFLTGFASTALFGPWVGRAADTYGRKKATLAFTVIYSLGAMSTKSPLLSMLLLGRVLSGIGTSLLFSAPEAWLVGESQKNSQDDPDGSYLGETFGLAYAGDSIVAILAGQFAGAAAGRRGPSGPFELSTAFLLLGGLLSAFLWRENVADDGSSQSKSSIREALKVVKEDPKIMLVGSVQSLFEAAMYIFVLQWPPAISGAISTAFGNASTPFGTVFSCFMACCLLGSTLFGQLMKMGIPTETFATIMLSVATLAMGGAAAASSSAAMPLWALVAGFFAFEGCVGMYFPSIGTLRSKYVPDSHRSVIMNLFGIPLNVLVVSVFLSIKRLGVSGALSISTGALGVASLCMLALRALVAKESIKEEVSPAAA